MGLERWLNVNKWLQEKLDPQNSQAQYTRTCNPAMERGLWGLLTASLGKNMLTTRVEL